MRRQLTAVAALVFVFVLAACAQRSSTVTQPAGNSATACDKANLNLIKPGTLTVATDSPAYSPWILHNDPSNGQGYESAVAYAVADKLGFSKDEVNWVVEPFNKSYAPGQKDFDFDINQISVTPERAKVVTFSDSYYDVTQALIAMKGTPIASATTMAALKPFKFGDEVGTTSLAYISQHIQPTQQPSVYDTLNEAKSALENGQIDGVVLDLPTASYVSGAQIKGSEVVGQFPTSGEHFGLLFAKGNPLVTCVNQALAQMKSDGTLKQLQQQWLGKYLSVPTIS
jgi:polar amino acid transport system substrate-binding protein